MHETGKAGAGMAEQPQHHVLPQEYREWFGKRGFTGAMDIDQFCVRLETANHQALHGGGNWRLGRTWPGGNQVLKVLAREMKRYNIPMSFTPWGGP